jgi:hypothetical protein
VVIVPPQGDVLLFLFFGGRGFNMANLTGNDIIRILTTLPEEEKSKEVRMLNVTEWAEAPSFQLNEIAVLGDFIFLKKNGD